MRMVVFVSKPRISVKMYSRCDYRKSTATNNKKSCSERRIARPLLNLQLWIHFVYTSEETLCTGHTLCKIFVRSSTTFIDRIIQYERKKRARSSYFRQMYQPLYEEKSKTFDIYHCWLYPFESVNQLIHILLPNKNHQWQLVSVPLHDFWVLLTVSCFPYDWVRRKIFQLSCK